MSNQEQKGFFQDLWDRRFFQYMGTYIGVGFGLIQFAQFIEQRYALGSWLVEKLFLFLLAMLPAVAVFIYNHGRKGSDRWKPFEKVFIPLSFIFAFGSALFFFNDAQTLTREVSITTEEGDTLTRVIPAAQFTKRLVIFPIKNETGDQEKDWMEVALPLLMDKDLEQDMRLFSTPPLSMKSKYDSYQFDFLEPLPFSIKLKIAQDYYSDYFIDGSFTELEDGLSMDVQVISSNDGDVFYEKNITGSDMYTLIDNLSKDLTSHLYVKDASSKTATYIDLPAQGLITPSPEALREYVTASIIRSTDVSRLPESAAHLTKSLELDPRCAECNLLQASIQMGSGNEVAANQFAEAAMSLADGLPERQQLRIRFINYMAHEEVQKAIFLLENWRTLYPNDLNPYNNLMDLYKMLAQIDKAKEVGQSALENGHRGSLLIDLAKLYIDTEDFDQAEKYIKEFEQLYPHKAKEASLLGDIYIARGQPDKAVEFYQGLVIFDPEDIGNQIKLAKVRDQMGQFDQAASILGESLLKARQPSDSMSIYEALEEHHIRLGQFAKAFEVQADREAVMRKIMPEVVMLQRVTMSTWPRYLVSGQEEGYRQSFGRFKALLPERAPLLNCVEEFLYQMGTENLPGMKQLPESCVATVVQTSGQHFELLYQAIIKRLEGEYAEAATLYEAYSDSTGLSDKSLSTDLSEAYRKSGQFNQAEELIGRLLDSDPYQPVFLLERARIAHDQGQAEAAREYLDKTLDIWQAADSTYVFYQEALALQREMESS